MQFEVDMGNRKLVIIASTFIVVLIIGILVSLNSYPPDTTLKVNVKITSFNYTGYINPVGIIWSSAFVLNYLNNGTIDVDNVTITITTNSTYELDRTIEVFNSTYPHYYIEEFKMGEPYPLGLIKAGEEKQFHGAIFNDLTDSAKISGFAIMATLKSNDTVLDEAIMN